MAQVLNNVQLCLGTSPYQPLSNGGTINIGGRGVVRAGNGTGGAAIVTAEQTPPLGTLAFVACETLANFGVDPGGTSVGGGGFNTVRALYWTGSIWLA